MLVQASRRKALSLANPAQRDMRLEWRTFRWKTDGFTAALDPILQELQGRRRGHAHPENPRSAAAGECAQLAELQSDNSRVIRGKAERLSNDVEPLGTHFTEELEGHVQPLIMHPANRPARASELTQKLQDLYPGRIRNRYGDK